MTSTDFEKLIADAGLNLISNWTPRFIVSLRLASEFGPRIQCGGILFASEEAFSESSTDEATEAIAELKKNLLRASRRLSGDIGEGMVIQVTARQENASQVGAINYPAH